MALHRLALSETDLFLTAGHCVAEPGGRLLPTGPHSVYIWFTEGSGDHPNRPGVPGEPRRRRLEEPQHRH